MSERQERRSEWGQERRCATYQDILDAPEHKVAELIDGELFLSPRPAGPHTSVASNLGDELGPPFKRGRGGPGGWILLDEPELHFDQRRKVLVPDLAGWRREHMSIVEDVPGFTIRPDWVCEVLSRSTQRLDRARKLPIYAAQQVAHAWLLHPHDRTLEVLRLHDGMWLTVAVHEGEQRVRAEPFDAIELDLASLWADLPIHANEPNAPYELDIAG
ncbi:MAG: Uma2 family endonuclease [Deltaproteobacteria bacterium]|nr:Uma2 family endonuclease [Deltaproteobacteria bacterium]